jgi:hypothetical protein
VIQPFLADLYMAASRSCRIPELQNLVTDKTPKTAPQASDAEIDEKDVEILMAQASCDHDKAVRLLKEANGDLINASASSPCYLVRRQARLADVSHTPTVMAASE